VAVNSNILKISGQLIREFIPVLSASGYSGLSKKRSRTKLFAEGPKPAKRQFRITPGHREQNAATKIHRK
jgi:hypothetical protein